MHRLRNRARSGNDVIWTAREPSKWLIHCHIPHHTTNNNAEGKGGGGLMVVIDVREVGPLLVAYRLAKSLHQCPEEQFAKRTVSNPVMAEHMRATLAVLAVILLVGASGAADGRERLVDQLGSRTIVVGFEPHKVDNRGTSCGSDCCSQFHCLMAILPTVRSLRPFGAGTVPDFAVVNPLSFGIFAGIDPPPKLRFFSENDWIISGAVKGLKRAAYNKLGESQCAISP